MTRVLVTGNAGFIGSHLAERLLQDGHEVIGVDNLLGGEMANVQDAVEFYDADCCDIDKMRTIFHRHAPIELVYHCAASPHEGLSVFSPAVVTRNTYLSTMVVGSVAMAHGVKRFVQLSSMARYGASELCPFKEWHVCNPVDPYGIAKVAAEDSLLCLGKEHGVEIVIAVPHSVIGPRQRICDPFRNVAAIMCNLMAQGRQPYIYGDGEQKRCFTFIRDAIDPLVKCGFQAGLDGEVINIGPDEEFITINELARRIAKLMNFHLDPVYVPDRPCEVKYAYCSSEKARRLLGYQTTTTLDEGLAEMVQWVRWYGAKPFAYNLPIEIEGKRIPKLWKDRIF